MPRSKKNSCTEDKLKELLAQYGEVESVIILKDKKDQRPKGYGFVMMGSTYKGQKVIYHTFG